MIVVFYISIIDNRSRNTCYANINGFKNTEESFYLVENLPQIPSSEATLQATGKPTQHAIKSVSSSHEDFLHQRKVYFATQFLMRVGLLHHLISGNFPK